MNAKTTLMTAEAPTAAPAKASPKLRAMKPVPMAADPERAAVVLGLDTMHLAEQCCMPWFFRVPAGTQPEDLHMRPEAFSACAFRMSLGDDVKIATDDDKLLMRGTCIYGNRDAVALVAIEQVFEVPRLDETEQRGHPDYEVRRATQSEQVETSGNWVVLRRSDGWLMNNGPLLSRDEAHAFLNNHPAVTQSTGKQLMVP